MSFKHSNWKSLGHRPTAGARYWSPVQIIGTENDKVVLFQRERMGSVINRAMLGMKTPRMITTPIPSILCKLLFLENFSEALMNPIQFCLRFQKVTELLKLNNYTLDFHRPQLKNTHPHCEISEGKHNHFLDRIISHT